MLPKPSASRVFAILPLLSAACASVPSGRRAVVVSALGRTRTLEEGSAFVGPLSQVQIYDVRATEHDEDLTALTAEGVAIFAGSSLVTYRLAPDELAALNRETGPDYYRILVLPLIRSTVRRVFAAYRWDELDSDGILRAQKEISEDAARRLGPFHIVLESVAIRGVTLASPLANAAVTGIAVEEQRALARRQQVVIAARRADALRQEGRGTDASLAVIAPTLTQEELADDGQRAWARLLAAPNSRIVVVSDQQPDIVEVAP